MPKLEIEYKYEIGQEVYYITLESSYLSPFSSDKSPRGGHICIGQIERVKVGNRGVDYVIKVAKGHHWTVTEGNIFTSIGDAQRRLVKDKKKRWL